MALPNDIVLRPRFSLKLTIPPEKILHAFENSGKITENLVVSRVDDHVFIRIPKSKQHFWSPQLHLEIYRLEKDQPTILRGLFGPNPTVWTLFMFAHFVIAVLFIAAGIWLYKSISLSESVIIPVVILVVLFIIWFGLYLGGRLGREAGKKEMKVLQSFMYETLNRTI